MIAATLSSTMTSRTATTTSTSCSQTMVPPPWMTTMTRCDHLHPSYAWRHGARTVSHKWWWQPCQQQWWQWWNDGVGTMTQQRWRKDNEHCAWWHNNNNNGMMHMANVCAWGGSGGGFWKMGLAQGLASSEANSVSHLEHCLYDN